MCIQDQVVIDNKLCGRQNCLNITLGILKYIDQEFCTKVGATIKDVLIYIKFIKVIDRQINALCFLKHNEDYYFYAYYPDLDMKIDRSVVFKFTEMDTYLFKIPEHVDMKAFFSNHHLTILKDYKKSTLRVMYDEGRFKTINRVKAEADGLLDLLKVDN